MGRSSQVEYSKRLPRQVKRVSEKNLAVYRGCPINTIQIAVAQQAEHLVNTKLVAFYDTPSLVRRGNIRIRYLTALRHQYDTSQTGRLLRPPYLVRGRQYSNPLPHSVPSVSIPLPQYVPESR